MRSLRYTPIVQSFVLLTVLAMVAAIVAFGSVPGGTQRAQAGVPTPTAIPTPATASASIEASGCDTTGVNPSKCPVHASSPFTISLNLDSIDGLPDPKGDTVAGYAGIEYELTFDNGEVLDFTGEQWIWPECDVSLAKDNPAFYRTTCLMLGIGVESLYTGVMVELEVNCIESADAQETITVTTLSLLDGFGHDLPIKPVDKSLTINCSDAVGGIAELPDVARPALAGEGSPGAGAGVVAAVAVAASAFALGGAAWFARRRWQAP